MISRQQRVWIVAAHFPPSNLASVHRARLLANGLAHAGWDVTVLSVDPKYYEEPLDSDLERLVETGVRVIRVSALSPGWSRGFGVGDLGIRAFPWLLQALNRATLSREMDLLHLTIPSNYQALLGPAVWKKGRVPYVLDYIDPWVPESPQIYPVFSKEGVSVGLGRLLEPLAVRNASGIMGITRGYFEGVIQRNPALKDIPTCALQYGMSLRDFELAAEVPPNPGAFEDQTSCLRWVYAGALLPKARIPMRALLRAIADLNQNEFRHRPARLIALGTGREAGEGIGKISNLAREVGAERWVAEFPERHPYLEVLSTLKSSDGVMVVGSTEAHYSPSKIFQAILSKRPVFALLHHRSEALELLSSTGAGMAVELNHDPDEMELTRKCRAALLAWPTTKFDLHLEPLQPYFMNSMVTELLSFYNRVFHFHAGEVLL